jgi:hypothetical protein
LSECLGQGVLHFLFGTEPVNDLEERFFFPRWRKRPLVPLMKDRKPDQEKGRHFYCASALARESFIFFLEERPSMIFKIIF